MYSVDVFRLVFYAALAGLAWIGELPWWLAPIWLLYDARYLYTYKNKAYKQVEHDAEVYYAQLQQQIQRERQAGTKEPKWN